MPLAGDTTAESCTAGRIAETLACVEKATEFLRGGVVAYQEQIKRRLLGVTDASVLTPAAATQMAHGVARLLDAPVTVATTGVAGGEPKDGVPPGTVCIATAVHGTATVNVHHFDGTPEEVCELARHQALLDLERALITHAAIVRPASRPHDGSASVVSRSR